MAGQVTPGKLFKGLHPDLKAIRMLAGLDRKNAETIFGAIGDEIEKAGIHLLDARVFMDQDLAEEGAMVKGKEKIEPEHLVHGIEIARKNARLMWVRELLLVAALSLPSKHSKEPMPC